MTIVGAWNFMQGDRRMASDGNLKSANQTYAGFTSVMKWGTVATIAVAAMVVLLISS